MAVSGKTAAPIEAPYFLDSDKPPNMATVTKAMSDRQHALIEAFGLDDALDGTAGSGQVLIAQPGDVARFKAMKGNATLAADGTLTIADKAVTTAKMQPLHNMETLGTGTIELVPAEKLSILNVSLSKVAATTKLLIEGQVYIERKEGTTGFVGVTFFLEANGSLIWESESIRLAAGSSALVPLSGISTQVNAETEPAIKVFAQVNGGGAKGDYKLNKSSSKLSWLRFGA